MALKLESIAFTPEDSGIFPPLPPLNNKGDDMEMGKDNVTFKDLQLTEEKLNSKIEVSEAKITGKIDALSNKIDSQSKLLYWIMGIISAGIIVPLIAAVIKILFGK